VALDSEEEAAVFKAARCHCCRQHTDGQAGFAVVAEHLIGLCLYLGPSQRGSNNEARMAMMAMTNQQFL